MDSKIHDFEESITELDIEKATATCKELKSRKSEELFDAIGRPLSVIGEKYEKEEYFLSELLIGEIAKEILKLTGNANSVKQKHEKADIVVLATVSGDFLLVVHNSLWSFLVLFNLLPSL